VPGAVQATTAAAAASGEAVLATDDNEEADVAVGASSTTDVVHVNLVVTRKTRVPITIGVKKTICRMRTKGMSWSSIIAELPVDVSRDAVRKIYRRKDTWMALADDAMTAMRSTRREGDFPAVDKLLLEWITAVERLGHAAVPVLFALLQEKAAETGRRLGLATFRASRGYVCGFLSRNGLASMRLHGQAGAVDTIAIERDLDKLQEELVAFKDDDIFNMNATGLFYRCLPSQSYVSNGARRTARGVKAMKAKDRVTVILFCNASGIEKLPPALIGSSKVPICFKGPDRTPPLPYIDQSNAWMDGTRFKKWFDEVFVPGVITHDRRKVALIMDNASSHGSQFHGSQVGHPQVHFFFLPPNSTARNQPLDAGIIAAVKRGYRRRHLNRVWSMASGSSWRARRPSRASLTWRYHHRLHLTMPRAQRWRAARPRRRRLRLPTPRRLPTRRQTARGRRPPGPSTAPFSRGRRLMPSPLPAEVVRLTGASASGLAARPI